MKLKLNIIWTIAVVSLSGAAHNVIAEKADRIAVLEWEAAHNASIPKQGDIEGVMLDGSVLITQGTLKIKADKLILKQDKNGARFGEGTGAPVYLTQKLEGTKEYFEVYAERIEFDERTNIIKLFNKAKLLRGKDESVAEFVQYNTETEEFKMSGAAPGSKGAADAGLAKGKMYPTAPKEQPTTKPK